MTSKDTTTENMHPSSRDSWISKHDDYVIIGPRNADLTATPANGCSRNSVVQWWCCVCVSFAFSASMFLRGNGKHKQNLPLKLPNHTTHKDFRPFKLKLLFTFSNTHTLERFPILPTALLIPVSALPLP
jgi:hypothetical protein